MSEPYRLIDLRYICALSIVEELRGAARMYETELRTKYAVAQGLRSILGMDLVE